MNIRCLVSLVATGLLLVAMDDVALGAQATSPPPQASAPATAPGNDADVRTANFFDVIGRGTALERWVRDPLARVRTNVQLPAETGGAEPSRR